MSLVKLIKGLLYPQKEMTESGTVRRLGDTLYAEIVGTNWCLEEWLKWGFITAEEYRVVADIIDAAAEDVRNAIPEGMYNRDLDAPVAAWNPEPEEEETDDSSLSMFDMSHEKNVIQFVKDKNNDTWFIGIYSNKYEDREGDILTAASHEEFAKYIDETGFRPVIVPFHEPNINPAIWGKVFTKYENNVKVLNSFIRAVYKDTAFAEVHKVIPMNGFVLVAAKVLLDKADMAERLQSMSNLGMSHKFMTFDEKFEGNGFVIDKYRSVEMSVLPRDRAANLLTGATVSARITEEKTMGELSPEQRQFLVEIMGSEEKVNTMLENAGEFEKLANTFLNFKSVKDKEAEEVVEEETPAAEPVAEETPEPETEEAVAEAEVEPVEGDRPVTVDEMNEVLKSFEPLNDVLEGMLRQIETLSKTVESLTAELSSTQEKVAEVEKSEDEKIASLITPLNFKRFGGYSAAKAEDNVIKTEEKKELTVEAPAVPEDKMARNPLYLGTRSLYK